MKRVPMSFLILLVLAFLIAGCETDELKAVGERVTRVESQANDAESRVAVVEEKVGSLEEAVNKLEDLTKNQMVEAFRELYGRPSKLDAETKLLIQDIRKEGQEAWAREFLATELKVPQQELEVLKAGLAGVQKKLEATPAPTPAPTPTPTPTATPTPTPAATPTATPVPTVTATATATPLPTAMPTATLVPAPAVLPVPAATSTVPDIPKETIFVLKTEVDKEGDKALAILSNLRGAFQDPGCPKEALAQPAETPSELRRCLTTKSRIMEWLGISTFPAPGREWLVLDQTIFSIANMGEKPLNRQPAFWFQVRPSSTETLMVELEAGAVKIGGLADPGGERVEPSGRFVSKERYLPWIRNWTKREPPSHLKPGKYAVYPLLVEK